MANAPVQVILNADSYRRDRETKRPNSAGTDFFEGHNDEFAIHKKRLQSQVNIISEKLLSKLSSENSSDIGYAKVVMRSQSFAKSHRPLQAIFPERKTPLVGGDRIGEMISEVSFESISSVSEAIAKAEIEVRSKVNTKTGEDQLVPTRYRCEVSAIDKIELWSISDRRRFDISEAIKWLKNPKTGHVYIVELFERPINSSQRDALHVGKRRLFETFEAGLKELGTGLIARLSRNMSSDSIFVDVCLTLQKVPPAIFVQSKIETRKTLEETNILFDSNIERHKKLIGFLENHSLVREIRLPNIVVHSTDKTSPLPIKSFNITEPGTGTYPKVGVIDGGISSQFNKWVVYRHGYLAPTHSNHSHGTFISGLLTSAKSLNPHIALDNDGCMIADIDLFPDENQSNLFEKYYSGGLSDFMDELESAVQICRSQYGIRVFNLSLNIVSPVAHTKYSIEARRLDKIAEDNDVIIVVSAGNLAPREQRLEWPINDTVAAAILASHHNDQLYIPAESVRNLSVSAINPAGLSNSIDGALAKYSRRGPGLRAGVKPDLCHVGGSGTNCSKNGSGLYSLDTTGSVISGCGTSYAAPLVAKTLATIDAQIEGEPSRETLIALAIHHARLPMPVSKKPIKGIAKQLVGFGQPSTAQEVLVSEDYEITLLFSSRIFDKKTLEFKFVWPSSLVGEGGKCRGDVRLTLVSTPNLNYQFGEEIVRVNIEAALQQEQKNGKYKSELDPTYVFFNDDEKASETNLIEHKFKWSPIKAFDAHMPKGRGNSSNWRLVVNYLTRAGETLPEEGIPFSIILTITDPSKQSAIFQEMRQSLQASGIQTTDIRTAARISPRV